MFAVSSRWEAAYPGASVGLLAMSGVANPKGHVEIEGLKKDVVEELRARFAGSDRNRLKDLPQIRAYDEYYSRFGKTYHVLLQLESVVLKGKGLPSVGSLVDTMFTAELRNMLLTAGHDLDRIALPLSVDVASGAESYTLYNGKVQELKPRDMYIRDEQGVLSSILYGPDQRTRITPDTTRALFAVYAPPGITPAQVRLHLEEIRAGAIRIAPGAIVERIDVYEARRDTA